MSDKRMYQIRRDRLWRYMKQNFSGPGERRRLAEAIDKAPDYVSRMFSQKNTKNIGEKVARDIESKLGLPGNWLDGEPSEQVDSVVARKYRSASPSKKAIVDFVLDIHEGGSDLPEGLKIMLRGAIDLAENTPNERVDAA